MVRSSRSATSIWRRLLKNGAPQSAILIASVQAIPEDEQLATMWPARNQHLADVLTAQVLWDREQGPASPDVPWLAAALLEMTMHTSYQDRLAKFPPTRTVQSLSAVRAICLAAVWGRSPATMKSWAQGGQAVA